MVKKSSAQRLNKTYFGGGTVDVHTGRVAVQSLLVHLKKDIKKELFFFLEA